MEAGVTAGPDLLATAEAYLAPLKARGVDTLVLGCTHYPLLTGVISYVMGDGVTLVSSAEETAKDVYRALVTHDLERTAATAARPTTSWPPGTPTQFELLARRFLGPEVLGVEHVEPRCRALSHRQPGPDHPGHGRRGRRHARARASNDATEGRPAPCRERQLT